MLLYSVPQSQNRLELVRVEGLEKKEKRAVVAETCLLSSNSLLHPEEWGGGGS